MIKRGKGKKKENKKEENKEERKQTKAYFKNSEGSRVFQRAKARIQQGATHQEPPAAYLKARKALDHR